MGDLNRPQFRVGIDVGGTFTDFALIDAAGRLALHKVLTTVPTPSSGVLRGLDEILIAAGQEIEACTSIVHGTTLVANAVIERKGARTALVTTAGFGDI